LVGRISHEKGLLPERMISEFRLLMPPFK